MDITSSHDYTHSIDTSMVGIANLINLLIIALFMSRVYRNSNLEHRLGLAMIILGIPILGIVIHNLWAGREWWTIVLPIIMVAYLCLELALDYIFKIEFRSTFILWPYLILFYLALLGLIGYAFLTNRLFGYITLCTYFLGLLASWYSYSKVGHGGVRSSCSNGSVRPPGQLPSDQNTIRMGKLKAR